MASRLTTSACLVLLACVGVGGLPAASANHPQVAHGDAIVFDHRTGNEWWVEVQLSGGASGSVASVLAMDEGGPWVAMTYHPDYAPGDWAASFHIEPGHKVKFRATWTGGDMVDSCWFTHPAGVEQCGSTTTSSSSSSSTTPPQPSPTSVTYNTVKGNEWWIEARAASKSPISAVDTRVNGGTWVPMKLQSWGAWAVSTHAAPGSHVQFRAHFPDGTVAFVPNGWLWTSAAQYPPAGSAFDAQFENVAGNHDWVQVNVYAPSNWGLGAVRARVDGGAWQDLPRQTWGDWAAPIHVNDGSTVEFLAFSAGQAPAGDMSGKYTWPPTGSPQPPGFDATFTNVKGNEWWAEAKVTANQPLAGVDVRLGCSSPWNPMTLRSWGAWALSTHIVPGTHVDFRARATGGATDVSGAYVWPQATPTDRCDHPWPRASSFADVRFSHELREYDGEGGEAYTFVDGLAHAYWTGTAWDGTCQQRVTRQDFSGAWSNVTENFQWDRAPPKGELPATVGGVADVQQIVAGCSLATVTDVPVTGRETRDFTLRTSSGDPIPIDAYHGQESTTGSFAEYWWAASNGLMLDWHTHSSSSFHIQSDRGWLLNTDASFS